MARTSPSIAARRRLSAETAEPRARTIRIAVAMPRALLRELLVLKLGREPSLEVVACVDSGPAVVETLKRYEPQVLLLDDEVHGPGCERFVRKLRAAAPATRILLLSAHPTDDLLEATLRAGGAGVVPAQGEYAMLLRALRAVSRGELWANRRLIARALEQAREPKSAALLGGILSPREREIAEHVGRGLRNKEIARRLGVTEKTVKNHLSNIFRKLNVDNRFAVGLYSLDIPPKP
jgi:two-component system response regulator DegU